MHRSLFVLAMATVSAMAALGILFPLLPFQALSLGASPAQVSWTFTLYAGGAFICAPLWGRCSDRFGCRPMLMVSFALGAVGYGLLANAQSLADVYLYRLVAGFSAGWIAMAHALVADMTGPDNRAKGMGLIGASLGFGIILGSGIGGLIAANIDGAIFQLAFLLSAGLSILSALICWCIKAPRSAHPSKPRSFKALWLGQSALWRVGLAYLAGLTAFSGLEGTFAIWVAQRFDAGESFVAICLVISGLVAILVQGGLVGPLVKRYGEKRVLVPAIIALAIGFIGLALSPQPWLIVLPLSLIAAAMGLHNPCLQAWASRLAPASSQGMTLGSMQSMASLARILGPLIGGALFAVNLSPFWIAVILVLSYALIANLPARAIR